MELKEINTTILLTGATGFLGSHLLRRLVAVPTFKIICLKRSFSKLGRIAPLIGKVEFCDWDKISIDEIFDRHQIQVVVHCATNYGRRALPPRDVLEPNLLLPLEILQSGCDRGLKTFINTDTILDKGVNSYSLSKKQFCEWLVYFSDRVRCVNVALEHFYGPFDDESKFVTHIIRKLVSRSGHIDLTPGMQKRDFIYIDDVIDAFDKIIRHAIYDGPGLSNFEVGSTERISIRDFVELAKRLVGNGNTRLNFGALPYRKNEVMESSVSIKALQVLGWRPRTTLVEGLTRTIEAEKTGK